MEYEVRRLCNDMLRLMILASDDKLGSFLPYFFQDPVLTAAEQLRHIGLAGISRSPTVQGALQAVEDASRRRSLMLPALLAGLAEEEAGLLPGMAGRTFLNDSQEECIAIAIQAQIHQMLNMAGGFAFTPECLPGA